MGHKQTTPISILLLLIPALLWATMSVTASSLSQGPPVDSTPTSLPKVPPTEPGTPPDTSIATPQSESSEVNPFDSKGVVIQSTTSAAPVGGRINIATTGGVNEWSPAIARCAFGQYLAVYVRDGDIYGQRLSSEGVLVGSPFIISDETTDRPDSDPDVACEWGTDRFVVVWVHDFSGNGQDYDVQAQAVYGYDNSGSQLSGGLIDVSKTADDELNPAIACNHHDHTCLVVYEYVDGANVDTYARRVSVTQSSISTPQISFVLGGGSNEDSYPAVAWGGADSNFLVVWQTWCTVSGANPDPCVASPHYRLVFQHLYDTHQSGSQNQHGTVWLISPGARDHSQTAPVVAYNRYTQRYLVAFAYDYFGDATDYDVVAQRISGTGASSQGASFAVADTGMYDETAPALAFSGGTENDPNAAGANQYLIAFHRVESGNTQGVYAQAVKGAYAASGSQLDGGLLMLQTTTLFGYGVGSLDLTGSMHNGRYLTVWQYNIGGGVPHANILGQMIAPYAVYLPIVVRDYPPAPLYPNDPDFPFDWRWPKVQAPEAWGLSTGDGSVIAIIDNGVDLTHPDLANVLWTNADEIASNGIDDDGNGYVDDVHGYDFFGGDGNPSEPNSHGTGVALVAGAQTNNGYANASMGWNVRIMALRIGDAASWDWTALETALQYARANGADVINISLKGNSSCPAYIQDDITAAFNAGVSVIASTDSTWLAPANCTGVIGVSASDAADIVIAPTVSSTYIDVAAPGSSTSHAAPMVAGLAALIRSRYPAYTADQIAQAILCNADDIGQSALAGEGRINAYKALLYGATGCGPGY